MSTPQPTPFPLRMPEQLREQLEARARVNGRSLNAEILGMLQAGLVEEPGGLSATHDIENLAEQIALRVSVLIGARNH